MSNSQFKLRQKTNKRKVVNRTVKLYSVAPDINIVKNVLKKVPNAVIKTISNAAINAR